MNIEALKKYVATEKISIPRQTVQGLLEVMESVLKKKPSPQKIVYIKGEGLYVERLMSKEFIEESFLTPYQVIRQHSELLIVPNTDSLYTDLLKANIQLSDRGCSTTCIVVFDRFLLPQTLDIAKAMQVPVYEDKDCPENCLFVCGSSVDDSIDNIECSVLLKRD